MLQVRTLKLTESTNVCYIRDRIYLANLAFGEGRAPPCYSVSPLENPLTYVKQG